MPADDSLLGEADTTAAELTSMSQAFHRIQDRRKGY